MTVRILIWIEKKRNFSKQPIRIPICFHFGWCACVFYCFNWIGSLHLSTEAKKSKNIYNIKIINKHFVLTVFVLCSLSLSLCLSVHCACSIFVIARAHSTTFHHTLFQNFELSAVAAAATAAAVLLLLRLPVLRRCFGCSIIVCTSAAAESTLFASLPSPDISFWSAVKKIYMFVCIRRELSVLFFFWIATRVQLQLFAISRIFRICEKWWIELYQENKNNRNFTVKTY